MFKVFEVECSKSLKLEFKDGDEVSLSLTSTLTADAAVPTAGSTRGHADGYDGPRSRPYQWPR